MTTLEAITLVLAGGVLGWLLARIPDVVAYIAMTACRGPESGFS